eukprot:471734-Pleurochrysis_carterae.AAC.9
MFVSCGSRCTCVPLRVRVCARVGLSRRRSPCLCACTDQFAAGMLPCACLECVRGDGGGRLTQAGVLLVRAGACVLRDYSVRVCLPRAALDSLKGDTAFGHVRKTRRRTEMHKNWGKLTNRWRCRRWCRLLLITQKKFLQLLGGERQEVRRGDGGERNQQKKIASKSKIAKVRSRSGSWSGST